MYNEMQQLSFITILICQLKMVSSKSANDSTVDFGKRDRCSRLFGALGKTSVLRNQLCGTETVNDILTIYTLTPSA